MKCANCGTNFSLKDTKMVRGQRCCLACGKTIRVGVNTKKFTFAAGSAFVVVAVAGGVSFMAALILMGIALGASLELKKA